MALWRRPKGRHAAGGPTRSHVPAPPLPRGPVATPPPAAAPPAPHEPAAAPPASWAVVPRVELTFRDGSSAALDGEQARALDEIARVLTKRD